jgi:hypothetical protein
MKKVLLILLLALACFAPVFSQQKDKKAPAAARNSAYPGFAK